MAKMDTKDMQLALAAPFAPADIEWRVGSTTGDKTRGLALAYLTSRAVMQRLDDVCGIDGWRDSYDRWGEHGVICRLSVKAGDQWITREDGAQETEIEAVKGGISDALKRAAVKFGIGRYLYALDAPWVQIEAFGKSFRIQKGEQVKLDALLTGHAPAPRPAAKPAPVDDVAQNLANKFNGEVEHGGKPQNSPQDAPGSPRNDAKPPAGTSVPPSAYHPACPKHGPMADKRAARKAAEAEIKAGTRKLNTEGKNKGKPVGAPPAWKCETQGCKESVLESEPKAAGAGEHPAGSETTGTRKEEPPAPAAAGISPDARARILAAFHKNKWTRSEICAVIQEATNVEFAPGSITLDGKFLDRLTTEGAASLEYALEHQGQDMPNCPTCGKSDRVDDTTAGQVSCSRCNVEFTKQAAG